ncbi:RND family efflux transporter [Brevundimonas goettingensis]|uniref:Uncharacterized protein n=1 Tax=Brevundimonas goettingensis TaxID=2774190 RepID=A0A975C399_9CAUL|nr:hypothetical protein [Brevundimonas goettingensis]QTC92072.1 hypothetical protein IFJ75_03935 [Brevundimonas goettingensis]
MIAILMAWTLQSAAAGVAVPVSDQCYAELAAGLNDPGAVSEPQVRARLNDARERLAVLAVGAFRAVRTLPHDRELDLVELKSMAARGAIKQAEVDRAAADWDRAMQGHRYVLNQILSRYPSCDVLGAERADPDYQAIVSAAARVTERPA